MKRHLLSLAILWLAGLVSAASNEFIDLHPLPRHVWDMDHLSKRDDAAQSVGLQDHEKFMWASGQEANTKVTAVSMVVYSKQDEKILDLDKVAFALESVTCGDKMVLKFNNKLFYAAAKFAWNWVNYNDLRSFVVVANWKGCGDPKARNPWVVSNAAFADKTSTITLDSVQSTWQKVSNSYNMDFGDIVLGSGGKSKRWLDFDLSKAFTVDLSSSFPSEIANWSMTTPYVDAYLAIECEDCGTQGTLQFAGHIEGSVFGGIDKFEVSATPHGIAAHLGLSLTFHGEVDFDTLPAPGDEFTLLELPLPSGWRVPGVLQFGPNVKINAGYTIERIVGDARVSTGITASVPDDSVAKVDLASKNPVEISGWIPEIETDPLEVSVQIDATAHVYTEVAVAASIEVLDENGVNVEIGIKVPDVTVTASAGYNVDGFCDNDTGKPFGLKLDASLGASLGLQGYTELKGDKDVFLDVTLYETPALYTFPQLCLAFGKQSPGACIPEQHTFDPDDSYPPGGYTDSEDDAGANIAERSLRLAKRDEKSAAYLTRKPYLLGCDEEKKHEIWPQKYQKPTSLRNKLQVPIMKPGMGCGEDEDEECPASTWSMDKLPDTLTKADRALVTQKGWASEHIYEGNWIRDFIQHLVDEKYPAIDGSTVGDDTKCKGAVNTFGNKLGVVIDTKTPRDAGNYSEALMQNLGTTWTSGERMALLPQIQNSMKYDIFNGNNIDASFSKKTLNQRVCSLGRIATVCKYMNHKAIRDRMVITNNALEAVLDQLQTSSEVYKPDGLDFKTAHQKWFEDMYKAGFENARTRLGTYLTSITSAELDSLDPDTKAAVQNVQDNCKEVWPLDSA
ncbi:hypothetical protein ATEIFO6365_0009045900 [Aspergillus terreus]|uniref:Uncharacterized protein n=1 Tax=Aspergillus terreus TaxID=33178 RepID=A0A5M3ZC23_ASPTE|nr:hypothetical protein ATETN484_0011045400 [Aspergillus terreus]GFF19096.1 hypothetical protein ATEIFO6365_0009045900 [Aspergillus terreus]